MILGILALLISLSISSIAIYFSVIGWGSLFSSAFLSVVVMFTSIEIGKLIGAGFLHFYWKELPKLLKYLLVTMVGSVMILTSIGIYGFLSKGHLDQELPSQTATLQIERLDQQIARHERTINDANSQLEQLDSIIQTLIDFDKISRRDGAIAQRENQKEQRDFLNSQIEESMNSIDSLQNQKLKYQKQVQEVEAKLGPIKYIVDILNVEDKDLAVQLVILLSIFVFDPFAVALLLAALWSFKYATKNRNDTTYQETGINTQKCDGQVENDLKYESGKSKVFSNSYEQESNPKEPIIVTDNAKQKITDDKDVLQGQKIKETIRKVIENEISEEKRVDSDKQDSISEGSEITSMDRIDKNNYPEDPSRTEREIQIGPRPPRPIDVHDFGSFELPKSETSSADELRKLLKEKPEMEHELEDKIKNEEPEIYKEVKHVFEEIKNKKSGLGNIRLID